MSAADRYQNLNTKVLSDGRVVYKAARPASVQESTRDIVITADERDRFDIIANNLYGSPNEWWRIASLNKHVNGSLHLKPNSDIRVPTE